MLARSRNTHDVHGKETKCQMPLSPTATALSAPLTALQLQSTERQSVLGRLSYPCATNNRNAQAPPCQMSSPYWASKSRSKEEASSGAPKGCTRAALGRGGPEAHDGTGPGLSPVSQSPSLISHPCPGVAQRRQAQAQTNITGLALRVHSMSHSSRGVCRCTTTTSSIHGSSPPNPLTITDSQLEMVKTPTSTTYVHFGTSLTPWRPWQCLGKQYPHLSSSSLVTDIGTSMCSSDAFCSGCLACPA